MMWQIDYSANPKKSTTVKTVKTFIVPNFVGFSQAAVDSWKNSSGLQISIHYSTALGYKYTVSCQMQKRGTVLKQNPIAGSQMIDAFGNTIWLDIDC